MTSARKKLLNIPTRRHMAHRGRMEIVNGLRLLEDSVNSMGMELECDIYGEIDRTYQIARGCFDLAEDFLNRKGRDYVKKA